MTRGIVYPSRTVRPTPAEEPKFGGAAETPSTGDDYTSKLVKYVPAEVIAFFTPVTALIGTDAVALSIATIVACVGTLLWTYITSLGVPVEQRARWYTYLAALVAFLAWAIGVSSGLRQLVGLSEMYAGLILAIVVFLLPALDRAISTPRRT